MFDPEFIVINFVLGDGDKNKFERVVNENNLVLGKYIDISLFMEICFAKSRRIQ